MQVFILQISYLCLKNKCTYEEKYFPFSIFLLYGNQSLCAATTVFARC